MTLQDLKSKIWSACDILRSQGLHITDYMEQITYLMFLKNLDEKEENDKELDKALGREHKPLFDDDKYYWKNWTQKSGRPLVKFVKIDLFSKLTDINGRNPIVKKIFKDAVFNIEEPQALKKVIGIIDSIQFYKQPIDVKGATYEFLLSKLAEAGAAGEFFTPRHIIKAMIDIVDPKIGETICDPAMGTGGFLIGALNHILKENGNGHEDGRNLTNEQFAFLHDETFFGYEQNRKTYRMALMNMYLHGANNPKLERINTLGDGTHTDRKYDVIFANPPYGGKIDNVRGNFTISTNKTELLFLQHIIQTLKEGGRAGVILPEGVMFQSGAAQKIREILLSQCETFTVVSMPAGVFQPYTGVKTDLLFFKKGTATQKVWFFDVKNDGFDLGSQRRPIKQDDLPMLWNKFPFKSKNDFTPPKDKKDLEKAESEKSWWADIKEIEENNWNLVAGRYKKKIKASKDYKIVQLGEVCDVDWGNTSMSKKFYKEKGFPAFSATGQDGFVEKFEHEGKAIVLSAIGARCGKCFWTDGQWTAIKNTITIKSKDEKILDLRFLYYLINDENFWNKSGSAQPFITLTSARKQLIPLPPIEIQKEIIEKLDQKKAIIDEANSLIEKVERERANAQEIFDELDCEWVKLSKVINLKYGKGLRKIERKFGNFAVYGANGLIDRIDKYFIEEPTIIVGRKGSCGELTISESKSWAIDTTFYIEIIDKKTVNLKYLYYVLKNVDIDKIIIKAAIPGINRDEYLKQVIPLPNTEEQNRIIDFFDKKQKLIDSLRENIFDTEKSMQKIIAKLFEI